MSGDLAPLHRSVWRLSTAGRGALTHSTQRTLGNGGIGEMKVRTQRRLPHGSLETFFHRITRH